MMGLIGAHRVGKTTLMNQLAKGPFEAVPISINKMQRNRGYDSSNQNYSFEDRMIIQRHLLDDFNDFLYKRLNRPRPAVIRSYGVMVTDRTPLDLIGYTLLALVDPITPAQGEDLMKYINDCIELTNKYFTDLILIQPGIELIPDPKSAPCDEDMIAKLNGIYMMYMLNSQVTANKCIMPPELTDLTDRCGYVIEHVRRLL